MDIVNLTRRAASAEQRAKGVFDLPEPKLSALRELLTSDVVPSPVEAHLRAMAIVRLVTSMWTDYALVGGPRWLTKPLEKALEAHDIQPCHMKA